MSGVSYDRSFLPVLLWNGSMAIIGMERIQ